jgi:hypothetical protein
MLVAAPQPQPIQKQQKPYGEWQDECHGVAHEYKTDHDLVLDQGIEGDDLATG